MFPRLMRGMMYPWLLIVFVSQAQTSLSRQGTPLSSHRDPYQIFTYEDHPCRRRCHEDAPNATCRYYFLLEHYSTMTKECSACPGRPSHCSLPHCVPGNGVVRGILTVNRMLPGPLIYVCEGDEIEVVVDNKMELGEGTSIHWHGLKQHGTQFMDGTNLVTQCPIHSGSKMLYKFHADDVGTHFWHAHSAIQRSGGIFGGIVIRQPRARDPQGHLYDHDFAEHVILLTDWHSRPIGETFSRNYFDKPMDPDAILINGAGRSPNGLHTPYPIFYVNAGQRYRFRMASNGIMNCPIVVSIDRHRLLVIATDGHDVSAVAVDSLVIYGGERFDFVVRARKQIKGNFWIRFQGQGRCEEARIFQAAILRYDGAPEEEPTPPATFNNTVLGRKILNDARSIPSSSNLQIVDLKTLNPSRADYGGLADFPDKQFYIAMGSNELETPRFHPSYPDMMSSKTVPPPEKQSIDALPARASKRPHGLITSSTENDWSTKPIVYHFNYILSILPPSPPLSQYKDIPENLFCNNSTVTEDCTRTVCECVHRLQFSLGDMVEMVLVGFKSGPAHPIHMHGHAFRVVSMMSFNQTITVEQIQEMDKRGEITRIRTGAPLKDTIMVRSPGLTVIQFRASNPGFWLFHCHIDFHAETGMSLILQAGNVSDMPRPPPHFPRCGDWIPDNDHDLEHDNDSAFDSEKHSTSFFTKPIRETTLKRPLSPVNTKDLDKFFEIQTNSDESVRRLRHPSVSVHLKAGKNGVKYQNILNKPHISPFPGTKGMVVPLQRTQSKISTNDKPLNSLNHLHDNKHQSKGTVASNPQTPSSLQTTETQIPFTSASPSPTVDGKPHLFFMTSVFIGIVLVLIVAATYAGRGRSCCERCGTFKGRGRGCSGHKTGSSLQATFRTALILDKNPADYLSIMATSSNRE